LFVTVLTIFSYCYYIIDTLLISTPQKGVMIMAFPLFL